MFRDGNGSMFDAGYAINASKDKLEYGTFCSGVVRLWCLARK